MTSPAMMPPKNASPAPVVSTTLSTDIAGTSTTCAQLRMGRAQTYKLLT